MNVSFDFESVDDFTTFVLETAGPVQTILANQTSERKKEILGAITEVAVLYYMIYSYGLFDFDDHIQKHIADCFQRSNFIMKREREQ